MRKIQANFFVTYYLHRCISCRTLIYIYTCIKTKLLLLYSVIIFSISCLPCLMYLQLILPFLVLFCYAVILFSTCFSTASSRTCLPCWWTNEHSGNMTSTELLICPFTEKGGGGRIMIYKYLVTPKLIVFLGRIFFILNIDCLRL